MPIYTFDKEEEEEEEEETNNGIWNGGFTQCSSGGIGLLNSNTRRYHWHIFETNEQLQRSDVSR
jgi:hypothetical protein